MDYNNSVKSAIFMLSNFANVLDIEQSGEVTAAALLGQRFYYRCRILYC